MQHLSKLVFLTHFRCIFTLKIESGKQRIKQSGTRHIFFRFLKTLKSRSDALDGLLGSDRWGVIEAVLDSSLKKRNLQAKQISAQIMAYQNDQKSSPDNILG